MVLLMLVLLLLVLPVMFEEGLLLLLLLLLLSLLIFLLLLSNCGSTVNGRVCECESGRVADDGEDCLARPFRGRSLVVNGKGKRSGGGASRGAK